MHTTAVSANDAHLLSFLYNGAHCTAKNSIGKLIHLTFCFIATDGPPFAEYGNGDQALTIFD